MKVRELIDKLEEGQRERDAAQLQFLGQVAARRVWPGGLVYNLYKRLGAKRFFIVMAVAAVAGTLVFYVLQYFITGTK